MIKKQTRYIIIVSIIISICGGYYLNWRHNKKLARQAAVEEARTAIFKDYSVSEEEKNELLSFSKSQIKQDIFVYLELNKKRNGFFVEFGATDGVNLSNTYMLEQKFGWRGILAEPALIWHDRLNHNRPNAFIEKLCVWKDTGSKLTFNETAHPELSTVDQFSSHDMHKEGRADGNRYEVSTISLLDLLEKYNAPQEIDYLSIDTEGSELDILTAYFRDNKHYKIKIITCEHNFTENREAIYNLLVSNGYKRKYEKLSAFDDFYVLQP